MTYEEYHTKCYPINKAIQDIWDRADQNHSLPQDDKDLDTLLEAFNQLKKEFLS